MWYDVRLASVAFKSLCYLYKTQLSVCVGVYACVCVCIWIFCHDWLWIKRHCLLAFCVCLSKYIYTGLLWEKRGLRCRCGDRGWKYTRGEKKATKTSTFFWDCTQMQLLVRNIVRELCFFRNLHTIRNKFFLFFLCKCVSSRFVVFLSHPLP